MINPSVYADLDHLFMLNFSIGEECLRKLVPAPMRLVTKHGRAFPSIVLPRIKNLRSVRFPWPRFGYEFMGVRILVEYPSQKNGWMKGIYFGRLVMDPNYVRLLANAMTDFHFERGRIYKSAMDCEWKNVSVDDVCGNPLLQAKIMPMPSGVSLPLPANSVFETPQEAKKMYNDIAYGFLPQSRGRKMNILQIADPHPNYNKWPLVDMKVELLALHISELNTWRLLLEPSYYVGELPRWWRWAGTDRLSERAITEPELRTA